MALWLVRAGRNGEREDFAIDENVAVIGWEELPDLAKVRTREELATMMAETYPDAKEKRVSHFTGQVWTFYQRMQQGDLVTLPLKGRPFIAIGRVTGPYKYRGEDAEGSIHTRA